MLEKESGFKEKCEVNNRWGSYMAKSMKGPQEGPQTGKHHPGGYPSTERFHIMNEWGCDSRSEGPRFKSRSHPFLALRP